MNRFLHACKEPYRKTCIFIDIHVRTAGICYVFVSIYLSWLYTHFYVCSFRMLSSSLYNQFDGVWKSWSPSLFACQQSGGASVLSDMHAKWSEKGSEPPEEMWDLVNIWDIGPRDAWKYGIEHAMMILSNMWSSNLLHVWIKWKEPKRRENGVRFGSASWAVMSSVETGLCWPQLLEDPVASNQNLLGCSMTDFCSWRL